MLEPRDEEFLALLDSDPQVMHFIHSGPMSIEGARWFAKFQIEAAPRHIHFHKWLVAVTAEDISIGWVQLDVFHQGNRRHDLGDDLQIGHQFAPPYWNAGYATEATGAVIDHAFRTTGCDRLVAFTRPEHAASVRVLEKLGFRPDGFCRDDARQQCAFFVLTAQEWRSRTR